MKREPLWHRLARRPSWERDDPPRFSDFDPSMPVRAAVKRLGRVMDRTEDRMNALLDRMDDRRTRR